MTTGGSRVAVLDAALAGRLARVALDNVAREYPNKLDHLMISDADVASPSALHPVFHGSYDWHSSVHMHWTLATLLRAFPALPEAPAIAALLDAHFAEDRVAGELAYLDRPSAIAFERPYGWAWLLKLAHALHRLAASDARAILWRDRLRPLADRVVERATRFLPRVGNPSRAGSHGNHAFALALMLDYAALDAAPGFEALLRERAATWYGDDRDYPVRYELSSEDFLSNGLLEAVVMRTMSEATGAGDARFAAWWRAFVPDVATLAPWLAPVEPADRGDARLTHIDGLNLSRAWCWSRLVDALPDDVRPTVFTAIDAHRAASLPHAAHGDYVGTHWLASFALLAFGF